jgi:hypothetical protein
MLFKNEIATPAFGGLAMTVPLVVIARSEATKQSRFEIATASAEQKPRNDSQGLHINEIATPSFGGLASMGIGF